MKTFLKVFLIVVLSLLAIKFVPFMFLGAMVGLLIAALLGMLGLGLVAALLAVAIALALALSPIWIPVLIVMGVISLFKKLNDRPAPPVMTA
jgi:H+/Cl- antiporter ClcA